MLADHELIDFDFALDLGASAELDVVLSRTNPLEFWKEIAYAGEFTKGERRVKIDSALMDHWRDTFVEMSNEGIQVPVPIEHTRDPERRRGTVKALRRQLDSKGRDSMFAKFRFRDHEAAQLAKTAGVSVFSPKQAQSGKTGRVWRSPLEHVCITDYPVIADLDGFEAVVLSWNEDLHPRHEKGDARGGEFASKEDGGQGDRGSQGHPANQPVTKHTKESANAIMTERLEQSLRPSPSAAASKRKSELLAAFEAKSQSAVDAVMLSVMRNDDVAPEHIGHVVGWAKAVAKALGAKEALLKSPNKLRSRNYQPPEDTMRNPINFSTEDDDMTLKDLAMQAQIDPNLPDDQILMALSKTISQLKGPAQTGARPPAPGQPPGQPGMPQPGMMQQQQRPFGMSQEPDEIVMSTSMVNLLRGARETKLRSLAERGIILPTVAKAMAEKYLADDAIKLSYGADVDDGFDDAVALLEANGPVVSMRGKTGSQTRDGVVSLSKTNGDAKERDILDEIATKRADEAKRTSQLAQR